MKVFRMAKQRCHLKQWTPPYLWRHSVVSSDEMLAVGCEMWPFFPLTNVPLDWNLRNFEGKQTPWYCHQEILFAHSSICIKARIQGLQAERSTEHYTRSATLLNSDGALPEVNDIQTPSCPQQGVFCLLLLCSLLWSERSVVSAQSCRQGFSLDYFWKILSTESIEQAKGCVMLENLWRRWTSDASLALIRGAWQRPFEYRISSPVSVCAVQSWVMFHYSGAVQLGQLALNVLFHGTMFNTCRVRKEFLTQALIFLSKPHLSKPKPPEELVFFSITYHKNASTHHKI